MEKALVVSLSIFLGMLIGWDLHAVFNRLYFVVGSIQQAIDICKNKRATIFVCPPIGSEIIQVKKGKIVIT